MRKISGKKKKLTNRKNTFNTITVMRIKNTFLLSLLLCAAYNGTSAQNTQQGYTRSENTAQSENTTKAHNPSAIYYTANNRHLRLAEAADQGVFPYSNTFDIKDEFDRMIVEDTNNDGSFWYYYIHYAMYSNSYGNGTADDWIFTEALPVKKGYKYHLRFSLQTSNATEKMEIFVGGGATSAEMKQNIMPATEVMTNREWKTYEATFVAEETGDQHIGFHACSGEDGFMIYLDDIYIDEGAAAEGPQTVTDVQITPASYGKLSATVSFKAPLTDMQGSPLQENDIEKIEVFRNSQLIKTFDSPAPGESLTFEDNGETVPIENGMNTYEFIAHSAKGKGDMTSVEAYIGIDIPVAIDNIIMQGSENQALIVWSAPNKGVHNGYISPSSLKYTVTRFTSQGGYTDVAEDLMLPMYEDTLPKDGMQMVYYYGVKSVNTAGESEYAYTDNVLVAGEGYELPFNETFSYYDPYAKQYLPALNTSMWVSDDNWQLFAEDGGVKSEEGGMLAFKPAAENAKNYIHTPIIDLSKEARPCIRLRLFVPENSNAKLDLNYSVYKESTLTKIKTITDPYNYDIEPGKWNDIDIDISSLAGWKEIRFQLMATAGSTDDALYIDNVMIYDNIDLDVAVTDITYSKIITAEQESEIKVYVKNKGMDSSVPCSMQLYCNDEIIDNQIVDELAVGDTCSVTFRYTPGNDDVNTSKSFYAMIDLEDEKLSNNKSQTVKSFVDGMPLKAVSDLAVREEEGKVVLTWSEPAHAEKINKKVNDDFESYENFIIENIGDYTMVDGDGLQTYGVNMCSWPNIFEPQSFIIFNPQRANLDLELDPGWTPHSGDKMIACFGVMNLNPDTVIRNNDWLITPELAPNTLFSFWAKSPNSFKDPEELELMYSVTDTDTASFYRLEPEIIKLPAVWTQYVYLLPADAKYVALHCVSPAVFALLADDFTYYLKEEEELKVDGYNIYRNGQLITQMPLRTCGYTDQPKESGEYYYEVETIYAQGTSPKSNMEGIDYVVGVYDAESLVKIYTAGGMLHIENAGDRNISVYTPQGYTIYTGNAAEYRPLKLERGVYIVKADDITAKVCME